MRNIVGLVFTNGRHVIANLLENKEEVSDYYYIEKPVFVEFIPLDQNGDQQSQQQLKLHFIPLIPPYSRSDVIGVNIRKDQILFQIEIDPKLVKQYESNFYNVVSVVSGGCVTSKISSIN